MYNKIQEILNEPNLQKKELLQVELEQLVSDLLEILNEPNLQKKELLQFLCYDFLPYLQLDKKIYSEEKGLGLKSELDLKLLTDKVLRHFRSYN